MSIHLSASAPTAVRSRSLRCRRRVISRQKSHADPVIRFWEEETLRLGDGLTLIRCGGHFAGGTVVHWAAGADGRGALLSGDILQVCADRRHVSFMYSYPNYIPLSAPVVRSVVAAVEPFAYDRVYGAWWDRVIGEGGKEAVARSVARYLRAIGQA